MKKTGTEPRNKKTLKWMILSKIKMQRPLPIFCINLITRKDRRASVKSQVRKYKSIAGLKFWRVKKDTESPIRGCRTSHLDILRLARERGYPEVCIVEDDMILSANLPERSHRPSDPWNILYLGASQVESASTSNQFKRVSRALTTVGYMVHSRAYDMMIQGLEQTDDPIDTWIDRHVTNRFILDPPIASQMAGYSDIENGYTDYRDMVDAVPPIREIGMRITEDNEILIKTVTNKINWPTVSIVTLTRNRRQTFPLVLQAFMDINYPRDKLEWIIFDDGSENLNELLPEDMTEIKYHRARTKSTDPPIPIGLKRNHANHYATGEIIVHMDDDDLYFPSSVTNRVQALLANEDTDCVGCTRLLCVDVRNKQSPTSFIVNSTGPIFEATMSYRRSFWLDQPFQSNMTRGESRSFLSGRYSRVRTMPCELIGVFVTHSGCTTLGTSGVRELVTTDKPIELNLLDSFSQAYTRWLDKFE